MATGAKMPTFYRNFPPANFLQQCRLPDFPQLVDNAFKVMDGLPQTTTELMVAIAHAIIRPCDDTANDVLEVFLRVQDQAQQTTRIVAVMGLAEMIQQSARLPSETIDPIKALIFEATLPAHTYTDNAVNLRLQERTIVIKIPQIFMEALVAGNAKLSDALFSPRGSAEPKSEWN